MIKRIAISAAWLAAFFMVVSTTAILANGQTAAAVCNYSYKLQGAQATKAQDNTKSGCSSWSLTYSGAAPVTVQTSEDAITWGTSGLTVTTGSLPTAGGFGVVKFTGYAPYLRIVSSGTTAQPVTGLLYGSLALVAAGGGEVPPYLPRNSSASYTPVIPGAWTSTQIVGDRTDESNRINMRTLGGNVLLNGQHFELICRAYPATPFTVKMTSWQPEGQYWANDANKYLGMAIRDSATDRRIIHVIRNRQNHSVYRCTDRTNTCSGGAIQSEVPTHVSSSIPVTFYYKDDGTTRTFGIWDFNSQRNVTWGNTATTSPSSNWITTPDQLCFTFASSNGNYPDYVSLLGYDFSSP